MVLIRQLRWSGLREEVFGSLEVGLEVFGGVFLSGLEVFVLFGCGFWAVWFGGFTCYIIGGVCLGCLEVVVWALWRFLVYLEVLFGLFGVGRFLFCLELFERTPWFFLVPSYTCNHLFGKDWTIRLTVFMATRGGSWKT